MSHFRKMSLAKMSDMATCRYLKCLKSLILLITARVTCLILKEKKMNLSVKKAKISNYIDIKSYLT